MPATEMVSLILGIATLVIIYLYFYINIRKDSIKIDKKLRKMKQDEATKNAYVKEKRLQNHYEKPSHQISSRTHKYTGNEPMTYELKVNVLSNNEIVMYRVLERYCIKNNLILLSKIRMADFIKTIYVGDQETYDEALSNVWAKHVDFLICDPNGFKPKVAIELDDSTHDREDRKERDEFVDKVYRRINLPIYHFREIDEEYIFLKLNRLFELETV